MQRITAHWSEASCQSQYWCRRAYVVIDEALEAQCGRAGELNLQGVQSQGSHTFISFSSCSLIRFSECRSEEVPCCFL